MANCMKCGRELNEGAMFCDKCGTPVEQESKSTENAAVEVARETEVIPEVTENKTELTVNKKILFTVSAVVLALVLVVTLCLGIHFSQSKKTASVKEPTTKSEKAVTDKKQDKKADKQEKELTEAEILRNEYFNRVRAVAADGETVVRNPDVFKGSFMYIYGNIANILQSENDNEFTFQINSDYYFDDIPFIIQGKYKSTDKRKITGDDIHGLGNFDGVDLFTYTDGGGSINAGIVKDFQFDYESNVSDEAKNIKAIISSIFKKDDIDIRSEKEEFGVRYRTVYKFIISNSDGSNIKWIFPEYGYRDYGITVSFDDGDNWCRVSFNNDYKNFYATEYRENDATYVLKYCKLNGDVIWSRVFECSDYKYDAYNSTSDYICTVKDNVYIVINDHVYILNKSNGEDVKEPILMKNYNRMLKYNNLIIVYGESNDDEIFAMNLDGKIVWNHTLDKKLGKYTVSNIQLIGNELLIEYSGSGNTSGQIYRRINADTGEKINELIM